MAVLEMLAGKPWNYTIKFKDAKNVWTDISQLEVRAQLRATEKTTGLLISNLHDYMTPSFVGNDLIVTVSITGAQTRDLYSRRWGNNKTGWVNIIASDVGTVDGRSLVVPVIQIVCKDTTTKATGVS